MADCSGKRRVSQTLDMMNPCSVQRNMCLNESIRETVAELTRSHTLASWQNLYPHPETCTRTQHSLKCALSSWLCALELDKTQSDALLWSHYNDSFHSSTSDTASQTLTTSQKKAKKRKKSWLD